MRTAFLAVAAMCLFAIGCRPFGTKTTVVQAASGQGVPHFVLPAEGAELDAPFTLQVAGDGVDSVRFEVDGALLYEDTADPFAWTLAPDAFAPGSHTVEVAARRGDLIYMVSTDIVVGDGGSAPPAEEEPPAPDAPISFFMPADGATVTAPAVVRAEGEGIESVRFVVDEVVRAQDSEAPFEWTLQPADYGDGSHELRVEADRAGVTESKEVDIVVSQPPTGDGPSGDIAADIAALRAGEWYEIPDSHLEEVAPDPEPDGNIGSVIGAWSGGAYDTKRDRLIVWGGGHGDYAGNEIYVFSLRTFRWSRITDPSPFWPGDSDNSAERESHPDGSPISRHSYDYLEYIPPPIDRFFVGGGNGLWKYANKDEYTYLFDFDTLKWEKLGKDPSHGTGSITGVTPDGRVWQHGSRSDQARLSVFDPQTKTWTIHADFLSSWYGYRTTGAVDPVRMKMVAIGGGDAWMWDLERPDDRVVDLDTSGDRDIEEHKAPGLAFDPVTEEMVAWNGGSGVYALDMETFEWTRHETRGVGTTPPSNAYHGTYGRWRYVPSLNVFVVVNSVSRNVFVYRHAER